VQRTVLVTGGAGFIGSNFVAAFLSGHPDARVVTLDALTYAGNMQNLQGALGAPNHGFVRGDICNAQLVEHVFDEHGVTDVVNFAAESHVDRSILDPGVFVSTNVGGTRVLLDAARRRGVRRFVQVSTDEVYGSLGESGAFTETTPLSPNSPYSASKAAADLLCLSYFRTYGLPVTVTRCSNNYGPYQFPEKLIPLMILKAMRDEPLPVYGDGRNVRDWIHVSDHCGAIDAVLDRGEPGEVYNIGGLGEQENIAIVTAILRLLGKPDSLVRFVKDRPGHDRRYAMDISRIRDRLGWRPSYRFSEGLAETVRWYQEHRAWVDGCLSGEYLRFYESNYGRR
jgi:dTDP-glucose 4,6-dehydratase